jgi:DNA-binding transcriptional regulator PaaX
MALPNKINVKNILLETIATAGLVSLAVLVPGALLAISKADKHKRRYQQKYYINKVVKEMIITGLVEYRKNDKGVKCLRLTARGREKLKNYALKNLVIKKPWRWDKKYRVIIFDIKEFKRKTRDKLRRWLEHLDFIRLQNSVWVYPYECREVIVLLKSHFKIGKEVLYMTVDSIENDKWLKEEFKIN